jgi:hypothetical protein
MEADLEAGAEHQQSHWATTPGAILVQEPGLLDGDPGANTKKRWKEAWSALLLGECVVLCKLETTLCHTAYDILESSVIIGIGGWGGPCCKTRIRLILDHVVSMTRGRTIPRVGFGA